MAKRSRNNDVKLDESSVYAGDESAQPSVDSSDDVATEATIERLESIAGGPEDESAPVEQELSERLNELDDSTDEEIDALEMNLLQDDERADWRDGTGRVIDDVAEERIAKLTEVGPMQGDQGVVSVEPGRDDTSYILRQHHPSGKLSESESEAEEDIEESLDETMIDREADEETGG